MKTRREVHQVAVIVDVKQLCNEYAGDIALTPVGLHYLGMVSIQRAA